MPNYVTGGTVGGHSDNPCGQHWLHSWYHGNSILQCVDRFALTYTDPCPSQFTYVPKCDRCYRLNYRKLTWPEAAAFCKTIGGYTIALETKSEYKKFESWYKSGNGYRWIIGRKNILFFQLNIKQIITENIVQMQNLTSTSYRSLPDGTKP